MAVSAPERQYLLEQINKLAQADLDKLWAAASESSPAPPSVITVEVPIDIAKKYAKINPNDFAGMSTEQIASSRTYMADLAAKLKSDGFSAFKNLPVLEVGEGYKNAVISDGNHRLWAADKLGMKTIPMVVSLGEDPEWAAREGFPVKSDLLNLIRGELAASTPVGDKFADLVMSGYPEIAANYHQLAGQVAASWFEESDPASSYIAKVADPLPADRVASSAKWALGADGNKAKDRLAGTLQRAVFDGARDTTLLNVRKTKTRWARYASANACAFCRLLATRGAAYRSTNTAATKVHDHCSCLPVEDRDNSYQPPDYVDRWQNEYVSARRSAGSGDTNQILAAWRQQGVS